MLQRTIQVAFNGGEISPEMSARVDARPYANGAARIANWLPTPQGPLITRPGTEYTQRVFGEVNPNLLPFVYSTGQSYCAEFGYSIAQSTGYVRLHALGGTLLYSRVYDVGEQASDAVVVGIAGGSAWLTFGYRHGIATGTAIRLTGTGANLPGNLARATTYYAIVKDSRSIYLELAATGLVANAIAITSQNTGYLRVLLQDDIAASTTEWQAGNTDSYVPGDLVYWIGVNPGVYYCKEAHTQGVGDTFPNNGNGANKWYLQTGDGVLTIPTPYTAAQLPDLHTGQKADVMKVAHEDHVLYELSRLGATRWTFQPASFGSDLTAPTNLAVAENRGEQFQTRTVYSGAVLTGTGTNQAVFKLASDCPFAVGDGLYCESATSGPLIADNYYVVTGLYNTAQNFTLKREFGPGGWADVASAAGPSPGVSSVANLYRASPGARRQQTYKVSAVDEDDIEGPASGEVVADNVLEARGAENVLTWDAVSGAVRYFIYREENGLYGFIGETEDLTFTDDNIGPDFKATPPLQDSDVAATFKPRAIAQFEQRLVLAGTLLKPQTVWMSRSSRDYDFSYRIPAVDDDRIRFTFASTQAHTIRHVVTLGELLILTASGEWRATSINSDAITPSTISIRPQSYVGASMVQPAIINSSLIYCAARGGRVRELGFQWQQQSYSTGDVSLRAAHLFDTYELLDLAYQKAPVPVCWFPSSSSKLLSFTYVPEEQVGAWAQHSTATLAGVSPITSVCVLPEDDEDRVYIAVERQVNGSTLRTIERLGRIDYDSILDAKRVDASDSYDGAAPAAGITLNLIGKTTKGSTVTVTASSIAFSALDVGGVLFVTSGGVDYRMRVTAFVSPTQLTARLETDIPSSMLHTAQSPWAWGARVITGLGYLEGETVTAVWSNSSSKHPTIEPLTVTGGSISLSDYATVAHVGLPFTCDVESLPVSMQVEAAGQGRQKNVNRAHLRLDEASGLTIGLPSGKVVPVEELDTETLRTGEFRAVLPGEWGTDGRVLIRQSQPLPARLLGMTLEVSVAQ